MNEPPACHRRLTDHELIEEVTRLAAAESQSTATLISMLAEFDARRLYLGQGCSSMFSYCTQVLHLAEHAAYNRIEAARASRRFPIIVEVLAEGRVHLSAVRLLAPHLTDANHVDVLREASHKSKRDVEEIVARLRPRPDVAPSVRKLPDPRTPLSSQSVPKDMTPSEIAVAPIVARPSTSTNPEPLAPGRYKVQFTVTQNTHDKLRRVQDLLRHRLPTGDPAAIFDRAISLLLETLEKQKLAATNRPRTTRAADDHARRVPAAVRRKVWARDGGRCRFEGRAGRSTETGFLEFHHLVPYAKGGATTVENLELRCAAHHRHETEQYFGLLVRETRPLWNILAV
jgi:5-methylcytosine-specific restriction endonuclease McrA